MYRDLIDGLVADLEVQAGLFARARREPYLLDEVTVSRTVRAYNETLENSTLFDNQLGRWRTEGPDDAQRREIERLTGQVARSRTLCQGILEAAAAIKNHTIDAVVRKPDELWELADVMDEAVDAVPWPMEITVDCGEDEGGEPMVMWRSHHLGFLGTATLTLTRDGGVDVRTSVADEAALVPLVQAFMAALADQVKRLQAGRG
jgi:hypothetical protein